MASPWHDEDVTTRDYSTLPEPVAFDDAVPEVDIRPVPDPEGGRNTAHHEALRDD